ncbi:hypothetical protein GOPIP_067_00040 [Gordonia polyisoprenivorans NBRC 16320 = JCM 10675]|nr:hypothetical protein GOPIP_067_00040 [Gordonia polyisoprenivorans NBRC 16320 = JCM 10675]
MQLPGMLSERRAVPVQGGEDDPPVVLEMVGELRECHYPVVVRKTVDAVVAEHDQAEIAARQRGQVPGVEAFRLDSRMVRAELIEHRRRIVDGEVAIAQQAQHPGRATGADADVENGTSAADLGDPQQCRAFTGVEKPGRADELGAVVADDARRGERPPIVLRNVHVSSQSRVVGSPTD